MTKRTITSLLLALCMSVVGITSASAQDRCAGGEHGRSGEHGRDGEHARSGPRAARDGSRGDGFALRMKTRLGLSDAQLARIRQVMSAERARMRSAHAARPDARPDRAVLVRSRDATRVRIAAILTPAQRTAFARMSAERSARGPAASPRARGASGRPASPTRRPASTARPNR